MLPSARRQQYRMRRVDLVGLVEHAVGAELQALAAHVRRGVVAEHDQLGGARAFAAAFSTPRPGAALQEDVDDDQIAAVLRSRQPRHRARLVFGRADDVDRRHLLERGDQVFADDRAVLDDERFQLAHGPPGGGGCASAEIAAGARRGNRGKARKGTLRQTPESRVSAAVDARADREARFVSVGDFLQSAIAGSRARRSSRMAGSHRRGRDDAARRRLQALHRVVHPRRVLAQTLAGAGRPGRCTSPGWATPASSSRRSPAARSTSIRSTPARSSASCSSARQSRRSTS